MKLAGFELYESPAHGVWRGRREVDGLAVLVRLYPFTTNLGAKVRYARDVATRVGPQTVVAPLSATRTGAAVYADSGLPLLAELLAGGLQSVDAGLDFAVHLCAQIGQLHTLGLVHRRLSPASVLYSKAECVLRLSDLIAAGPPGVAPEAADPDPTAIRYVAPEQTGRTAQPVDCRSDLYALGMVLYEVFTGAPPFASAELAEWVHWHLAKRPETPSARRAELPKTIGEIILKLLAKDPAVRYQTASGVAHDLVRCQIALAESGMIPGFSLGQRDCERFTLSDRFYGRESALERLVSARSRADGKASVLVSVVGVAGQGKSALMKRFREHLVPDGLVGRGKFEATRERTPYPGAVMVLEDLGRQLLGLPEAELQALRHRLERRLGRSKGALLRLIPSLLPLFGDLNSSGAESGAAESRNQLTLAARGLVSVLAARPGGLTLIFDDVQWADPGCIELIASMVAEPALGGVLLISCSRPEGDAEGGGSARLAQALGRGGVKTERIELGPLGGVDVERLVRESLCCDGLGAAPLARHLMQVADGNPFEMRRALVDLHAQGELRLARGGEAWVWSGQRSQLAGDGRLDVLAGVERALDSLPPESRRLIGLSACLGARFALAILAEIEGRAPAWVASALEPAVAAGLLVVDGALYFFAHDRLQDAVASLSGSQRPALNLHIGRRLMALDGDHRYAIADHLNAGREVIEDPSIWSSVLEANAAAARQALGASAYRSAGRYAQSAYQAIANIAELDSSRRLSTMLLHARTQYLTGAFGETIALLEGCAAFAESFAERAVVYGLQKDCLLSQGTDYRRAVDLGLVLAAGREIGLPMGGDWGTLLEAEVAAVETALGGRAPASLIDLPRMHGAQEYSALKVLMDLWEAAYYAGQPELMSICAARMVRISLRHGNASESAFAYVIYGMLMASRAHHAQAFEYGFLALELNQRFDDALMLPKVTNLFCNYIDFLHRPFGESARLYANSATVGRENGDYLFGLWAAFFSVWTLLLAGRPLAEVIARADTVEAFVRSTHDEKMVRAFEMLRWTLDELVEPRQQRFRTHARLEAESLAYWREHQFLPSITWHAILRAQTAIFAGDPRLALDLLTQEGLNVDPAIVMFPISQLYFWRGLAAAMLLADAPADTRGSIRETLQDCASRVAEWAALCPPNFAAKARLLEAELAADDGARWQAAIAFGAALEAADTHDSMPMRAIVQERTGAFWAAAGQHDLARHCARSAQRAYAAWGATAKAQQFSAEPSEGDEATVVGSPQPPATGQVLDLQTVLDATRAMSTERSLGALLRTVTKIAVESAGAERGLLVTPSEAGWVVVTDTNTERAEDAPPLDLPVDEYHAAPGAIIRVATRMKSGLVLPDASLDPTFASDPYVSSHRTRSVICVPLVHEDVVEMVLYLENNLAPNVFQNTRLDVLRSVLGQARTFVDNVRLLDDLVGEVERHKTTTTALALSASRLRLSHHFSGQGVWDWDIATGDLFWSDKVGPLFGYLSEIPETSYANYIRGIHPEDRDRVEATIQSALAENAPPSYVAEHRVIHPGGAIRWIRGMGGVVRDDAGRPIRMLGVVQDITEQVAADAERERLGAQLQQAQKMEAIGQLTSGIAHDFNNILTATAGYADIARRDLEVGELQSVGRSLQQVLVSTDRAQKLVDQLLSYTGRRPASAARLDLEAVVHETLVLLKASLPSTLEIVVRASVPAMIWGDRTGLGQILMNCCINAWHAMGEHGRLVVSIEPGYVSDAPCVSCHKRVDGDYVMLCIEDSGHGMDAATIQRIFDPFFTTKKTTEGTGMGLAMVHAITHRLGGHIRIQSVVGEGTRLSFFLPTASPDSALASDAVPEEAPLSSSDTGRSSSDEGTRLREVDRTDPSAVRILVVDDEVPIARLFRIILTRMGCQVEAFSDPLQALAAFERAPDDYDLILTDQTMPDLTGAELARKVLAIRPEMPIIVATGYSAYLTTERAQDLGIRKLVRKPLSRKDLTAAVREVLGLDAEA